MILSPDEFDAAAEMMLAAAKMPSFHQLSPMMIIYDVVAACRRHYTLIRHVTPPRPRYHAVTPPPTIHA